MNEIVAPSGPRWTLCGPDAVLMEWPDNGGLSPEAVITCLESVSVLPAGLQEWTVGFRTILWEFTPGTRPGLEVLQAWWNNTWPRPIIEPKPKALHEIPVIYNGPDIGRVCECNRLTKSELIELHSGAVYHVAFLGFSPGFAYLEGLPQRLHTPRLDTPRPQVRAGSVAIGGSHAGVYPVACPGGWNVIGHTDLALFHPHLTGDKAFRLRVGDEVIFHPIP